MTEPSLFVAFVLGLVQGIGEFLPISSSAHLAIFPWLVGWQDPGLAFDVALHVGTLVAVLIYFRQDLSRFVVAGLRSIVERKIGDDPDRKMAWFLVVGSVPGAVLGLLLEKRAESAFRHPLLIATSMLTMGIVLFLVDTYARRQRVIEELRWRDALLIGLAQGCAIVPGVSRSGSTITAGRLLTFDRASAARFSFLLSIPITAGAALVKVPKMLAAGAALPPVLVGMLTAFVSGYLALDLLLRWVKTQSFLPFVLYRVGFAIVVGSVFWLRG